MTYDDWKLQTPPEEPQNECSFCGIPCEGTYCSDDCKKAETND